MSETMDSHSKFEMEKPIAEMSARELEQKFGVEIWSTSYCQEKDGSWSVLRKAGCMVPYGVSGNKELQDRIDEVLSEMEKNMEKAMEGRRIKE